MDKRKRGSRWVLIAGILIIVLGLIHVAVTPLIYQTLSSQLPLPDTLVQVYMFAATGAAVIFAGLLILYASHGLRTSERWAWVLALSAGAFATTLGLGAVLAMPDSPFAYLMLIVAVVELIPLWLYRQDFQEADRSEA